MKQRLVQQRIVIMMLTMIAVAGAIMLNSRRLNTIERRLVGVWEYNEPRTGIIFLLPDRREFRASKEREAWLAHREPSSHWYASEDSITFCLVMDFPSFGSLQEVRDYMEYKFNGRNCVAIPIQRLDDNELELKLNNVMASLRRSRDPELLRIYDRLAVGKSP